MTPEQKAALEGVAGGALSDDQLSRIEPLLDSDNRNDVAITQILSEGRLRLGTVSTATFASWAASTGMRAVIEDKAVASGDPLRSSALALRDVLTGGASGIRMDHDTNREMLNAWVTLGALTEVNRDALLELAKQPDPIALSDVSKALNVAEGRMTL